jgi:hypothetical protein
VFAIFFKGLIVMSLLLQLSQEAGVPQFCCDQVAAGDGRITFEASDLEMLTNRIWNVYEDEIGVFQMQLQLQGHCLGKYELQPLPADLSTIESEPGYFTLHGYILELAVEVPPDVAKAMSAFAEWSKANKGVSKPEGRPYLFYKVTSAEALVQLVVTSSYNKSAGKNELSFNGWAYQGIEWGGTGIGATRATKTDIVAGYTRKVLPPAPAPAPVINDVPPASERKLPKTLRR